MTPYNSPHWDYRSDLDEQPCGRSREREQITVHCPRCGAVELEWMPVDYDLIGEELPDCLCGERCEAGDLPADWVDPGVFADEENDR